MFMKLEDHISEHQRAAELTVSLGDVCPFNCGQQVPTSQPFQIVTRSHE